MVSVAPIQTMYLSKSAKDCLRSPPNAEMAVIPTIPARPTMRPKMSIVMLTTMTIISVECSSKTSPGTARAELAGSG